MSRNRNNWDASIRFTGTLWNGKTVPAAIKESIAELPDYAIPILQKHSPVKTGKLRSSWVVDVGERTIAIKNPAYYAGFVDQGTRKIRPRKYVDRSVREIMQEFTKRAGDNIVRRAGGKTSGKRVREALDRVRKLQSRGTPIRPIRRPITKNGVPIYGGSGR